MRGNEIPFWPRSWEDPSYKRQGKPRTQGLTMVIDKGLGLHAFEDIMALAADYVDIYKLGFGTSVLYPVDLLKQKVERAKEHGLKIMPGGTFFEIAVIQGPIESYLARLKAIGFNAIEISDGTFSISPEMRRKAISLAVDAGFTVYTEYGKKEASFRAETEELLLTLEQDLRAGATCMIVEARESGTVGLYNAEGQMDLAFLREVCQMAGDNAARLIWEAPQKDQQVALMQALGWSVNLGNIAHTDVLAVETLRRGLRADTAASVFERRRPFPCE
jgi:phosphosulfolactate synthase